MELEELKSFLELKVDQYNTPTFIEEDPISIPHQFSKKEDIEIAGFLTATIAWGNRKSIIKSANKMMDLLDRSPHEFVINHESIDLKKLKGFVHRTFNAIDFKQFIESLRELYKSGGLEYWLCPDESEINTAPVISRFKKKFFSMDHQPRTQKHIADPLKGSSAKRINMFLRWMVRQDNKGVDFGIWNGFPTSKLSIPLDVHTGNVSRQLRMISRSQNDATTVKLLDEKLRQLDPVDPVKYDFALFGLGVYEGFGNQSLKR